MANVVLEAIKNRRSVLRFDSSPIEQDEIEAILEAVDGLHPGLTGNLELYSCMIKKLRSS